MEQGEQGQASQQGEGIGIQQGGHIGQQQQHEPIRKLCSECQQNLTGSSFSAHQWGLSDARRRCKTCLREDMEQAGQLQRQQKQQGSDAIVSQVVFDPAVVVVESEVVVVESQVVFDPAVVRITDPAFR
jgi:hypothetical protein